METWRQLSDSSLRAAEVLLREAMNIVDEQAVIDAVRRHIGERRPGGATLEIVTPGIRRDQDWWYVPIRPSIRPEKRYEYYETLADIEKEIEKTERITVLLIPAGAEPGPQQANGQANSEP